MYSLTQLTNHCQSSHPLTPQQIHHLQLTLSHLAQNSQQRMDFYSIIQQSRCFWDNAYLLITQNSSLQTKLQALYWMDRRIKNNWLKEEEGIRGEIKMFLCKQVQGDGDGRGWKYYKVVNKAIAQILKYQWNATWKQFLSSICQAILQNQPHPQNYFDLIKTIFHQLFPSSSKLTFHEQCQLKQLTLKQQKILTKCFIKYLYASNCNTLKICVQTLQSILEWMPVYHVYSSVLLKGLVDVLEVEAVRKEVIGCLMVVVAKDRGQDGCLSQEKYLMEKQNILLSILRNVVNTKSPQQMYLILQILINCQTFLTQKSTFLTQNPTPYKEHTKPHHQQFLKLLLKLVLTYTASTRPQNNPHSQLNLISIIQHMRIIMYQKYYFDNIINIFVSLAPCPYDSQPCPYDSQSKIMCFDGDYEERREMENRRQEYCQVMGKIVDKFNKGYVQYVGALIDCSRVVEDGYMKQLTKIAWNIFYYITVNNHHPTQKIYEQANKITNKYIKIQQVLQAILLNTIHNHNHKPQSIPYIQHQIKQNKNSISLILSNPKLLSYTIFYQPYKLYITSTLAQRNVSKIKAMLHLLHSSYNQIDDTDKQLIHAMYVQEVCNIQRRIQGDLVYVRVVANWGVQVPSCFGVAIQYIQDIISVYKRQIRNVFTAKRYTTKPSQLQKYRQKLQTNGINYFLLLHTLIPILKSQMINQAMYQYDLLLRTKNESLTNSNSQQSHNVLISSLFISLTQKVFNFMTDEEINKDIHNRYPYFLAFIQDLMKSVGKWAKQKDEKQMQIYQENLKLSLESIGVFVARISQWSIGEDKKFGILTYIVKSIYECNLNHETVGYPLFLYGLARCKILPNLPQPLPTLTLSQFLSLSLSEHESTNLHMLQIFQTIFQNCYGLTSNPSYTTMLNSHILDLINKYYQIIITGKYCQQYYLQYGRVLYIMRQYVCWMDECVAVERVQGEGYERMNNLEYVVEFLKRKGRVVYQGWNEQVFVMVDGILGEMFYEQVQELDFCKSLRDILVILKRGY